MAAGSSPAPTEDLVGQVLGTWHRNNDILLDLLDAIPPTGMGALPSMGRGRNVALQFHHLDRVRRGWLQFHATGKRPTQPRADKSKPPAKPELRKALRASGRDVEDYLARAIRGEARIRMFNGDPIRWMGYLIAHDAHHRGQMLLALKQSGVKIPMDVSIEGVWGSWIFGK